MNVQDLANKLLRMPGNAPVLLDVPRAQPLSSPEFIGCGGIRSAQVSFNETTGVWSIDTDPTHETLIAVILD